MAKPKKKTLVQELYGVLHVYTDKPHLAARDIEGIEGVTSSFVLGGNPVFVNIDPRYDQAEIAQEIRDLLSVEVPDVFKE